MGSLNVNTLYPDGYSYKHGDCFHQDGYVQVWIDYSVERPNQRNAETVWTFNLSRIKWGNYGSGYRLVVNINVNGTSIDVEVKEQPEVQAKNKGVKVYITPQQLRTNITDSSTNITVTGICTFQGSPYHTCTWGNGGRHTWTFNNISVPPYVSDVPPTNVQGGAVYNKDDVQNGNSKPDWNFKANWWGESGGTYTIQQYNMNIYRNGQSVSGVERAGKMVSYNFESLMPKCKPGETYDFYIDTYVINKGWLRKCIHRKHKII